MVKIAILSHGLIHNTKVILSRTDAAQKGRRLAPRFDCQGIPEPLGNQRIRSDGPRTHLEHLRAEQRRAAQGARHHRGGQLPVRAGTRVHFLQGKTFTQEDTLDSANPSGRCHSLLRVTFPQFP